MISRSAKYSCKYYSVGYFIFIESYNIEAKNKLFMEPIIEVEDEAHGKDLINWLNDNQFVAQQIANVANNNY